MAFGLGIKRRGEGEERWWEEFRGGWRLVKVEVTRLEFLILEGD